MILRLYFKNEVKSLQEKADYVFEKHFRVSYLLDKFDWDFNRSIIDFNNKELACNSFLKSFKKTIKRHTYLKSVDDNYVDEISSSVVLSLPKNYDYEFIYNIETNGLSKYNSILRIYNVELISYYQNYESWMKFIKNLILLFPTITLEVFDPNIFKSEEKNDNNFLPSWMTYFDKSFELPNLPKWVKVETLSNGGHLIITTEEVFSPENPEHKEKARILLPFLQLKSNAI
jgi:hypothetical protein